VHQQIDERKIGEDILASSICCEYRSEYGLLYGMLPVSQLLGVACGFWFRILDYHCISG